MGKLPNFYKKAFSVKLYFLSLPHIAVIFAKDKIPDRPTDDVLCHHLLAIFSSGKVAVRQILYGMNHLEFYWSLSVTLPERCRT